MNRMERVAEVRVDAAHAAAARSDDPVAFLRRAQAKAEEAYLRSGSKADLAVVRAFAASLDWAPDAP